MISKNHINVIGAGLAGCEAAFQITARGIPVKLYDMKPGKMSPAHHSSMPAELVCSNSLKSTAMDNASGVLKKEMELLGSVILESAYENMVPAGGALAVDRETFSEYINNKIQEAELITLIHKEVAKIPHDEYTVIATGPLTSDVLAEQIKEMTGDTNLYFYDAAAPVIEAQGIDRSVVYEASRYGKGTSDYLNCPMDREQYRRFYDFLIKAEKAPLKSFEKQKVYEGCMPVEVMAARGYDTLRFGPMKPVGLPVPGTGKDAYAVVQLRTEDAKKTLYNLVGFQTNLKFGEQKKLLEFIPGLGNTEIVRYGVMHRNTYIKSPGFLNSAYRVITDEKLFFAGQITGVEGYMESAVSGICAGIQAARRFLGEEEAEFPKDTVTGSLAGYISSYAGADFQPMNANFGILPPLDTIIRNKKERKKALGKRAVESMISFCEKINPNG